MLETRLKEFKMKVQYLDLKRQIASNYNEYMEVVNGIVQTSDFINGREVDLFAKEFSEKMNGAYVVPLANGTDALYVSLKMLGIGEGDEVITTSSSWISTSETITQVGAKVVFVDIDEYHTIDSSKIEAAITANTRAIIPVHLYGQMCEMGEINRIANKYKLKVIEDCAQAHFSIFRNTYAGLLGDVGTFSFYPGKNLGAWGDAGAVVTKNKKLAEKIKAFSNHGAHIKHEHFMEGINSRMDTIQAAVLRLKLRSIDLWTEERKNAADLYSQLLSNVDQVNTPLVRVNTQHTYHVYAVFCNERDALRAFLASSGIQTQIHYPNALPAMEAYSYLNLDLSNYSNSMRLQRFELSLPIFPGITKEEIKYVVDRIKEFYLQS